MDPVKDDFFNEPETGLAVSAETALAIPNSKNLMEMAEFMSRSTIIPAAFQGKPANCFVALEFANRIGCNVLMVAQNLHVISGNPSWSSKFMTAVSNSCGKFTPVRYKMTGTRGEDSWGCIAYMTEKETGDLLEGPEVTISIAKKEGWYQKSGSKWQSIPEMMLHYRAATFLIRLYAPELMAGLHTVEEREDMTAAPVTRTSAVEAAWEATHEG